MIEVEQALTGTDQRMAALADGGHVTDYDALPYLSLPIAYTQPARLAAIAALHGLAPSPPPDRARILELGCASGGNLLPMAARWPNARFVGFDLSARQIADGQRRVNYFGLNNLELAQADLADLRLPPGSFDYVICHGVFSWVPPAVQEAILGLIGQCLSDNGVAAVSYNVSPGWHLRNPVREFIRYYAGTDGTPPERVERARSALAALGKRTGPGAYGALMRAEAELLEKIPSSYILGEFLAEHNRPVQFLDFTDAAAAHGLEYIGEADLDADARSALTSQGLRHVDQLSEVDRGRAAQELDFLCGRPFRRTLLRRRTEGLSPVSPTAAYLSGLHLAARLRADPEQSSQGDQTFIDRYGRRLTTRIPEIGKVLTQLGLAYPATLSVDAILGETTSASTRTAQALLGLVCSGRAVASVLPIEVGRATDPRPKVWRYARWEAALGLPGVCSLHHVAVALPKIGAMLATMADGTRDRNELTSLLAEEIVAGRAPLADGERQSADVGEARSLAQRYVADTLRHLGASAVLAP